MQLTRKDTEIVEQFLSGMEHVYHAILTNAHDSTKEPYMKSRLKRFIFVFTVVPAKMGPSKTMDFVYLHEGLDDAGNYKIYIFSLFERFHGEVARPFAIISLRHLAVASTSDADLCQSISVVSIPSIRVNSFSFSHFRIRGLW